MGSGVFSCPHSKSSAAKKRVWDMRPDGREKAGSRMAPAFMLRTRVPGGQRLLQYIDHDVPPSEDTTLLHRVHKQVGDDDPLPHRTAGIARDSVPVDVLAVRRHDEKLGAVRDNPGIDRDVAYLRLPSG